MSKREFKIAAEVAAAEFENWLDAMDIYIDESELDADDLAEFKKTKGKIERAIKYGDLTFNDDGEAVYMPFKSEHETPITFHERTGASMMATDTKKKGHDGAKTYAMMADMTRTHSSVFSKMKGADIKLCEALFQLLMD